MSKKKAPEFKTFEGLPDFSKGLPSFFGDPLDEKLFPISAALRRNEREKKEKIRLQLAKAVPGEMMDGYDHSYSGDKCRLSCRPVRFVEASV